MASALPSVTAKDSQLDTDIATNVERFENGEASEPRMDGGFTAWMQVLGSWILFANTWFVQNSPTHNCRETDTYNPPGA